MTRVSSNRLLRLPVRFVDGHWETALGGHVPVNSGAGAVLTLDRRSISDNKFLEAMDLEGRHNVLPEGPTLLVSLSVKPDSPPVKDLREYLITHDDKQVKGKVLFTENRSSVPPSYVEVTLGKPDVKPDRGYKSEWGGLWLVTHGLEAVGLGSTTINLPPAIVPNSVMSLNRGMRSGILWIPSAMKNWQRMNRRSRGGYGPLSLRRWHPNEDRSCE